MSAATLAAGGDAHNTRTRSLTKFTEGKPNPDRTWTECFAQLVGTVLSLWDAAELDAAGEDGEILPKFINLTDASIKMVCRAPIAVPPARFGSNGRYDGAGDGSSANLPCPWRIDRIPTNTIE